MKIGYEELLSVDLKKVFLFWLVGLALSIGIAGWVIVITALFGGGR